MRLYRATQEDRYTGTESCWTDDMDCARAYQDNPGFGGPVLLAVDVDPENVLDLRPEDTETWRTLADFADREWDGSVMSTFGGLTYPEQIIEDRVGLSTLREQGYDWVVYQDSYPEHCETWVYLGDKSLAAEEIRRGR